MILEDIFLAFPLIIIVKHIVATELYADVESYTSFVCVIEHLELFIIYD